MTPEEAASRGRHPVNGRRSTHPLRAIHSDTHSGGQESSRATENAAAPRPSLLAVAAVVEAAGGIIATAWTGDLRLLVTALAVFAVLAVLGAHLERRPR